MHQSPNDRHDWGETLAEFLRHQPGVSAVRIGPENHKVEVATVGNVDLAEFQSTLGETISAIEEQLRLSESGDMPHGFTVSRKDGATQVSRESCETAEKFWLWREVEWPEIPSKVEDHDSEWRELSLFAAICGVGGIMGFVVDQFAPEVTWLSRGLYLIAIIAGAGLMGRA